MSKLGELCQRLVELGAFKANFLMFDGSGVCDRHFSMLNVLLVLVSSLKIFQSERLCDELPKFTFQITFLLGCIKE